jgi:hypothetical protein
MKAIFTIAAKNYIAQARTLGDSLAEVHPEIPFYVFLADEAEGQLDLTIGKHTIIEAKTLGIPKYEEMSFKYDIIEFSTAIKPFCFDYLFTNRSYSNVIYLDPDIYVYNKLDYLFNELDKKFILMTPHHVTPEVEYTGMTNESLLLFVGIYNFGFVALNNTKNAQKIISWWKKRLEDYCFADKTEGLHVDQKWMDFIPAFFSDGVGIIRHLGCNVAFWNMHERTLINDNGTHIVRHRIGQEPDADLLFFHFAAFDPNNYEVIHKHNPQFKRSMYPEFIPILSQYAELLLANNFSETQRLPYSYGEFDNGEIITKFQRRLYRRLIIDNILYDSPFSTREGSFYADLANNKLLAGKAASIDYLNEINYNFKAKKNIIDTLTLILLRVIKFNRYSLLSKFLLRYLRPENQVHLLKSLKLNNDLINENRVKNTIDH